MTERDIGIRPAQGADAEAMLPLIQRHAAYERGVADIDADTLRAALDTKPPVLTAWVVERGGRPIGYAAATTDFSTWTGSYFLHLDCLFVDESHRGCGLGAALLDAVRNHAVERGITQVQWQTPDWNERAIHFYCRAGASIARKARFTLVV